MKRTCLAVPNSFPSRALQIGIETIPILSATEILSHTPATAILMWIKIRQDNLAVHFRFAPRCLSWVDAVEKSFALLITNSPSCRRGDLTNVWGRASKGDELASDFGNWPGDMSTNNRRVFRLSAGN